jgi:serine/threonine protein kinase/WD40 repeat protein
MTERTIFLEALDIADPAQRQAYLDRACAGDAALRRQVEALLAAHERSGSFLDVPALDPAATSAPQSAAPSAPGEGPGTRIGPYKLLQLIGEGGMGVVFMADQEHPVRRRVALKIIKPGMDSAAVLARFEAERQALALMDHINIARVLDAGSTDNGRPYFVMELVHGVAITRFCDDNQLTLRERLELLVQVCQAVQHAHTKGIIHRDLKPSNILVTRYDDRPVPKVIDFGVAKATAQRLTDRTLFTAFGSIVGTFEYMSPEQAEFNALGVDTRSDVYSLGVLLYELLTGTTPLQRKRLRQAALDEVVRLIREEEPPRPSARLSSSETLPVVAAARRTEPARLARLVRGELDWIVMKCLEKDRSRRFETASALARDLQRYLADEPVEAGPPGAGYRVWKFASRYRKMLAAVLAFVLLLLAGVLVSTFLAVWATWAERDARIQRDDARDANTRLREAQEELQSNLYASRAGHIQNAWDADGVDRVRVLLRLQLPRPGQRDLRGFEWHYRDREAHAELSIVPLPDAPFPSLSPDGRRVVSWVEEPRRDARGMARRVKVWDAATGKVVLSFAPWTEEIRTRAAGNCLATFSADGGRIVMASSFMEGAEETSRVVVGAWDASTGKEQFMLLWPGDGIPIFPCLTADGRRFAAEATHNGEHTIKVWNTLTRKELLNLRQRPGGVFRPAFSPDGTRLAAIVPGQGGERSGCAIMVWASADGRELLTCGKCPGEVSQLAFSPDGKRLAAVSGDGSGQGHLTLWDVVTGKELLRRKGPFRDWGSRVVFSPDGTRLACASFGPTVTIHDSATGRVRRTLKGCTLRAPTGQPMSLAFSGDGERLVTIGSDRTVRTWDATASDEPVALEGRFARLDRVVLSDDGTRVAAVGMAAGRAGENEVKVWGPSGKLLFRASMKTRFPTTPPGRWLALALSGNGRRVAVASDSRGREGNRERVEGEVRVWEVGTGKQLLRLTRAAPFGGVTLSRDGNRVAAESGTTAGQVKVWHVASGQELRSLPSGPGWGRTLAFSPDGTRLAGTAVEVGRTAVLQVWVVATGREVVSVKEPADGGLVGSANVAWSRDGRRLAWTSGIAGAPADVKLLDAATGRDLLTLRGHSNFITRVAFSPDGRRIVSLGLRRGSGQPALAPSEVKVWDADTASQLLALPAEHIGRVLDVVFSSDGHRLHAAGPLLDRRGCAVKTWEATPRAEQQK